MKKKATRDRVIRAAGGLVWRQTDSGPKIALIHRHRYGGDWSLPKGKLKEGESWEEAALREVREETGCQVKITSFAGSTTYTVDGVPKEVRFWNMIPMGECNPGSSDEVSEVVWLGPEEAVDKIDYPDQRKIVSTAGPSHKKEGE